MMSSASLTLFLAFISSVHSDVLLTQPKAETTRPGGFFRLTCKTSGFDLGKDWMHWVRQVPKQGLQWLLEYKDPSSKTIASGIESRFIPSKDTLTGIFALDMMNLRTEDTAIYYCARDTTGYREASLENWGGGTMLTVTDAAPFFPFLYGLLSCEQSSQASSVTFGCLAMDYTPTGISISWKKDTIPITTGLKTYPVVFNKKGTYTRSSQLTITESEAGNSAIYCVIQYLETVMEVKMPDRTVFHPTVVITVNGVDDIKASRKVTAVCSITEFRPAKLTTTWLRNGQPLNSGVVTSPAFELNGNFSATSWVTFPAAEWFSGSVFTCQVTHRNNTQSRNISISQDPNCYEEQITIQQPTLEQVLLEATVTLTCVVSHAPYGVQVAWSRGEKELKSEITFEPGEARDSVISNLSISTEAWLSGDEFHCVVSHKEMPTPKRASIRKYEDPHPLQPSVSIHLPPTDEVSAQKSITLTCFVRGFSPRLIFVKWTIDHKPVDSRNYKNTEVVAENGNRTFFMYSVLSVGSEQWNSGVPVSCVVGHETLPMKTIVRTVNRSSGKPSFVNVSLILMDTANTCQ